MGVRLFRIFHGLSILAKAFSLGFANVCWVGLLVVIPYYVCAVFLTRLLGHNAEQWGDEACDLVRGWFGSIGRSMYTLFMIMTLANWDTVCSVTMTEYPSIFLFFMVYIIFSSYTVISMITGVICEALVCTTENDEAHMISELAQGREAFKDSLRKIFSELDVDQSGMVTRAEIEQVILSDKHVSDRLESLRIGNLSKDELMGICDCIHKAHAGAPSGPDDEQGIPIEDFVHGMMSVRGQASAKQTFFLREDVKALTSQHRKVSDVQDEMARDVENVCKRNEELLMLLKQVAGMGKLSPRSNHG